ncbi:WD40/YVTN/BNR-like repeat-containing protein, partial [Candidatus Omnitrophota bacterium]
RIFSQEEIISLIRDYGEPNTIYAASKEHVYKTDNNASAWEKIFSIRKADKKINRIYAEPKSESIIYVLTQYGLFQSKDQGNNWQRLFKGSSDLENNCLSIAVTTTAIFLGTEEGLFISNNQGKTWQKSFEHFSDSIISAIVADPHKKDIMYVACEKGIFVTVDSGSDWRRIYVVYRSEIPSEDYDDSDGQISDQVLNIKGMAISNDEKSKLYIATTKGLFFTYNIGKEWHSLTKVGLPSLNIRSMAINNKDKQPLVATDKGIFGLVENRWKRIGGALSSRDFSDLCIDKEGALLIAGKRGVFRLSIEENIAKSKEVNYGKEDIEKLFVGEPTIEQVQAAAIEYSEVNMNKIKSWRRQARLKALIPTFSVGYDKVIYGSSSGAMAIGPRDWGMDISWDLADFIWSTDQTTIDSRSRLTVQLRQDILNQVTNLYYERRRIKAELLLSPPEDSVEELYRNFEIQQVTADIDGLTNNFFSRSLRKK